MDKRTRTALEGSIAKWQAIVDGTGKDEGASNCPLCRAFADEIAPDANGFDMDCAGCPVREKTGNALCFGSPYEAWSRYQNRDNAVMTFKVFDDKSKRLAQAELDFLISLRPEDKP